VLDEQKKAALRVSPWPVGGRLGQNLDRAPHRVHRGQAEAEQAVEPVRPTVAVAATARGSHHEPDRIGEIASLSDVPLWLRSGMARASATPA
jgi:hypothetical protein